MGRLSAGVQVVAYNKMDVPDASDYWPDLRELLLAEGIADEDCLAISAVAGQGTVELIRRVRALLEQLPAQVRPSSACHVLGPLQARPAWPFSIVAEERA